MTKQLGGFGNVNRHSNSIQNSTLCKLYATSVSLCQATSNVRGHIGESRWHHETRIKLNPGRDLRYIAPTVQPIRPPSYRLHPCTSCSPLHYNGWTPDAYACIARKSTITYFMFLAIQRLFFFGKISIPKAGSYH